MTEKMYWAYRHTNGSLLVKRYRHGFTEIEGPSDSPFIAASAGPVSAPTYEAAVNELKRLLPEAPDATD